MSQYLTATELAELCECKPNQRQIMINWLDDRRWIYAPGRSGLPRVARAYHDRKMGINDDKTKAKYAETPNLQAFAA
ncbi:MAG: DUF4224 domain-containing protein [Burkholderiaceae bacterium]|nr:DUF4224 domain-containing protein [Burkholderiaceae bacterium]